MEADKAEGTAEISLAKKIVKFFEDIGQLVYRSVPLLVVILLLFFSFKMGRMTGVLDEMIDSNSRYKERTEQLFKLCPNGAERRLAERDFVCDIPLPVHVVDGVITIKWPAEKLTATEAVPKP